MKGDGSAATEQTSTAIIAAMFPESRNCIAFFILRYTFLPFNTALIMVAKLSSAKIIEEAKEAERLGCTYITAGHIFLTDCKKGLPGRGLTFLQNICENVSIPVYAIGGISNENINDVRQTGAAGACIMSGFMKCNNIAEII